MKKPNFLIVGAQKSGTTWMRKMLLQHPDVFMVKKEIHFFNKPQNYSKGPDWYLSHFGEARQETAIGEKTPGYLLIGQEDPLDLPGKIHALLPDVKLIAILRNPVERAISAVNHNIRMGRIPRNADIDSVMKQAIAEAGNVIRHGFYFQNLQAYSHFFEPSQMRCFIYEDDVVASPSETLYATCEYLGVDPGFTFTDLQRQVNAQRISNYGLKLISNFPVGYRNALRAVSVIEGFLGKSEPKKRPSAQVIDELYELYSPENEKLFSFLGREVESWKKTSAYVTR